MSSKSLFLAANSLRWIEFHITGGDARSSLNQIDFRFDFDRNLLLELRRRLTCSTWRVFLNFLKVFISDEAGSNWFDALDLFRLMLVVDISWCARLKWKKEKEMKLAIYFLSVSNAGASLTSLGKFR